MKDLENCKNISKVQKLEPPKVEVLVKYWSSTAGNFQHCFFKNTDEAKDFVKTLLSAGITPDIYSAVKLNWDLVIK